MGIVCCVTHLYFLCFGHRFRGIAELSIPVLPGRFPQALSLCNPRTKRLARSGSRSRIHTTAFPTEKSKKQFYGLDPEAAGKRTKRKT